MPYHQASLSPSAGLVQRSSGSPIVVKRAVRSERSWPPFALRRPAAAVTTCGLSSASGSAGVNVTTVESSFHSNVTGTAPPPSGRSVSPASTEARSIRWLKVTTTGLSGSTKVDLSLGSKREIAGWMVEKLQVKSASSTPSAAEVSPARMRTEYSVLGSSSVGMKR